MTPVLDWPTLLQRVNGNAGLAQRLLAAFFAEYAAIDQSLAGQPPDQVRHLLHRMAGSALNLALSKVAGAVRDCEEALAAGHCPDTDDWRRALDALCREIKIARDETELAPTAVALDAPCPPAPPVGEIDALAERLAELLATNDLAALAVASQWAQSVPPADHVDTVLSAIQALDFATAAQLLHSQEGPPHD
jgi:HPt (histidine-containing phosphotransfer) domain-containing protein